MEGCALLPPHQHQVLQVGDDQGAPVPEQEVEDLGPGEALHGVHVLGEDGEPILGAGQEDIGVYFLNLYLYLIAEFDTALVHSHSLRKPPTGFHLLKKF